MRGREKLTRQCHDTEKRAYFAQHICKVEVYLSRDLAHADGTHRR